MQLINKKLIINCLTVNKKGTLYSSQGKQRSLKSTNIQWKGMTWYISESDFLLGDL